MAKQRRDADRRVRQCERFARLIRITQMLLGHGRWGPEDLAKEIECSPRTIYRDITTLSMAGIPIHFDKGCNAYRVPDGYRFPGIETKRQSHAQNGRVAPSQPDLDSILADAELLLNKLREMARAASQTA